MKIRVINVVTGVLALVGIVIILGIAGTVDYVGYQSVGDVIKDIILGILFLVPSFIKEIILG